MPGLWNAWVVVMFNMMFPAFLILASGLSLGMMVVGLAWVARRALLAMLEVGCIVEAAREAKLQNRAPILRAWLRLDSRWRG